MRAGHVEAAHNTLRRAEDIVAYLRETLDHEQGGDVAVHLQSLYFFCQRHLRQARIERDPGKIEQVSELLGRLRESWAAIERT
jgi:flagellar protein FliS